jgi:TRAP-type C4-dicarboxylate transport system substrate-binding protein
MPLGYGGAPCAVDCPRSAKAIARIEPDPATASDATRQHGHQETAMRPYLKFLLGALAIVAAIPAALAAEVTLRFHQFLPLQGHVPKRAIEEWIKRVEKDSGGRVKVQHFPSMQLGGKPPELYDQAKEGVVDLAFSTTRAEPGSRAFQEFVEKHAMDEFKDVKLIAIHIHGPGLFHMKTPVTTLEDLKGMKVRGGSRIATILLENLGATPVGMPVTAIGESLQKGVISGATIPFEVVPSLRLEQLVKNHTTFSGDKGLYTLTFAVVMNKGA